MKKLLFVLLLLTGCNLLGPVGGIVGQAIPQKVSAEYAGLAHQRIAIVVWAEPGIRTDFPDLQVDTAAGLQEKFKQLQLNEKPVELEGSLFPVRADTIARYQEDHPELEAMPILDFALKFNSDASDDKKIDRLIYIEIKDFSTRSDASLELYKGNIAGTVKVIEIKDGKAKAAYTSDDVKAIFPKDSPTEGLPDGTDSKIYMGTVDAFTNELSHRFYTYEKDPE